MTAPNSILFDTELLQRYAIIRSTPLWKDVRESMVRLERLRQKSAGPYDQMDLDRDNVLRYAAILRNSSDAIAYGVCLAAHLARFSATQVFEQRLNDGLLALSSGLDLPSLTDGEIRNELQRCARAAFPNLNLDFPRLDAPTGESSAVERQTVADSDKWRKAVDGALSNTATMEPPNMDDVAQRAADFWQARLVGFLSRSGQPEIPPDIDYLRCRAAKQRLGTVLRGRLRSISLREWCEVYVSGMSKSGVPAPVPLWFALAALGAMGFDVPRELSSVESPEEISAVNFVSQIPTTSSPKGLLVLRLTAESQTTEWKISSTMPALVLTPEDFLREGKVNLQSYFLARLTGVLVEVARDEPPDAAQRRAGATVIKERFQSLKVGLLMVAPNETAKRLSGGAVAVNPADASAACAQAFPSSSATAGSQP